MSYIENKSKVGDVVILTQEHESLSGKFEKGTKVTVTGISERGYDIEDEYGHKMIECGWIL